MSKCESITKINKIISTPSRDSDQSGHLHSLIIFFVVLSPPVKYFTDRSKAVLLLWIFYVFSVLCLLCLCARLFICALWSPAGKGLTSWLSFVVSNSEFVTFPLVSWVRCGT